MKEIREKNGFADSHEHGLGMAVAPGPFALDTIRSILAQHKAIRSAYFYFDGYRLMPQCNSLVSRASLLLAHEQYPNHPELEKEFLALSEMLGLATSE